MTGLPLSGDGTDLRHLKVRFYVSHMTPIKRARVHVGSCRDCNEGKGQVGQHRNGSGQTGWSSAFATFREAMDHMESEYGGFPERRPCKRCRPERFTDSE